MHVVETISVVGYWDYCVFNSKSCYWLFTPGDLLLISDSCRQGRNL